MHTLSWVRTFREAFFVAGIAAAALTGCDGGHALHAPALPTPAAAAPSAAPNSGVAGTLTIALALPARATSAIARRAKYVSPAVQSVALTFTPSTGSPVISYQNLAVANNSSCVASLVSPLICTVSLALPPATYTANVQLFDGPLVGGVTSGNVLAANVGSSVTINAGQANTINLTLDAIPTSLLAIPSGTSPLLLFTAGGGFSMLAASGTQGVTFLGADADGNAITGPGAPAVSVVSGTPGVISVSSPTAAAPNLFGLTMTAPTGGSTVNLTVTLTPPAASGATPLAQAVPIAFYSPPPLTGTVSTFATTGISLAANTYTGFATGAIGGTLYFTANSAQLVYSVSPTAVTSVFAGNGSTTDSSVQGSPATSGFYRPSAVFADPSGTVYIGEFYTGIIRSVVPATGAITSVGTVAASVVGMAINGTYASGGTIYTINPSGTIQQTTGGTTTTLATVSTTNGAPYSLAIDSAGNLYVPTGTIIQKVTPAGAVSTYAGTGTSGTADGALLSATFQGLRYLTFDGSGALYALDATACTIRKLAGGQVTTFAGTSGSCSTDTDGSGTAAAFSSPRSIATDLTKTKLFVLETGGVIRLVQ